MNVEEKENLVYENRLDYNGFPANEYKYFDLLSLFNRKLKTGEITQEEFDAKRAELLTEYHDAADDVEACFTSGMKQLIVQQREVKYRGGKYTLKRILLGRHFRESRWYYQAELLDKNGSTLVIADWQEVVKENKRDNE